MRTLRGAAAARRAVVFLAAELFERDWAVRDLAERVALDEREVLEEGATPRRGDP